MSTWTWTYVRIDKLTEEQINGIMEAALRHGGFEELDVPFEKHLKDWLELHEVERSYYINSLGIPPSELTEERLTEELKERREVLRKRKECYEKVISGEMSFYDMLEETGVFKYYEEHGWSGVDIMLEKRRGRFYVNLKSEIFRNRKYTEEEFSTIDSMIEFLKTSDSILDYGDDSGEYGSLTPQLEKKLREYYGKIGDHNFIVQFD